MYNHISEKILYDYGISNLIDFIRKNDIINDDMGIIVCKVLFQEINQLIEEQKMSVKVENVEKIYRLGEISVPALRSTNMELKSMVMPMIPGTRKSR
jgi:hypothetical protein